jgi:hypothetical protein
MRRPTCHRYRPKIHTLCAPVLFTAGMIAGCTGVSSAPKGRDTEDAVTLTFRLALNPRVYQDSLWADPPQLAIWLVNEAEGSIRTVRVTHRTAAGDWAGKVECSVALPYWVSFYNRQTGTHGPPTWDHPAVDAVTCATPRAELAADVHVPRGSKWTYFIEVNVSGDFNAAFPRMSDAGETDRYGNGQPSLVYRGRIDAVDGAVDHPQLIGHTHQHLPLDEIDEDLTGITTAKDLLREITVSCTARSRYPRSALDLIGRRSPDSLTTESTEESIRATHCGIRDTEHVPQLTNAPSCGRRCSIPSRFTRWTVSPGK